MKNCVVSFMWVSDGWVKTYCTVFGEGPKVTVGWDNQFLTRLGAGAKGWILRDSALKIPTSPPSQEDERSKVWKQHSGLSDSNNSPTDVIVRTGYLSVRSGVRNLLSADGCEIKAQ